MQTVSMDKRAGDVRQVAQAGQRIGRNGKIDAFADASAGLFFQLIKLINALTNSLKTARYASHMIVDRFRAVYGDG